MKLSLLLLSLAAVLTQTGCVTGRRTFAVPVPTAAHTTATKGPIYISAVTDDRVFQNKPRDPSIPSIDGDVTTMSAAQKNQMIGRQRNTWGHAMGDIALANGDTVTARVKALVEGGLRREGYTISEDPASPASLTALEGGGAGTRKTTYAGEPDGSDLRYLCCLLFKTNRYEGCPEADHFAASGGE